MKENVRKNKKRAQDIQAFWDEEAQKKGLSWNATVPDFYLKQIELRSLLSHIPNGVHVLDIGCGNGYSALHFARSRHINILGIDYAPAMIEKANEALFQEPDLQKRMRFQVGDVTKLALSKDLYKAFDIALTERCLINLASKEEQMKALRHVYTTLKENGLFLMCEDFLQGLANLNVLRKQLLLPEITTRWHNIYINEEEMIREAEKLFDIVAIENISSTYYLLSRVMYARLAADENKEPEYMHSINRIASQLPVVGNFGPLKLFILKKK